MTSANARTVANVVLISAGVAAAYVVITTPPLRRLALRGLQSGWAPAFPRTWPARSGDGRVDVQSGATDDRPDIMTA